MHHHHIAWGRRPVAVLLVAVFAVSGATSVTADHKPEGGTHGSSPVSAPAETAEPGWVWVPTVGPDRIFQPISGHGILLWYLDTISPGASFALEPQRQGFGVCTLGNCIQTGDFDILFYRRGDAGITSVSASFETLGDEQGTVPADAAFAYVFLKTPGVLPEGSKGWGFYYLQGDPGRDRLPSVG